MTLNVIEGGKTDNTPSDWEWDPELGKPHNDLAALSDAPIRSRGAAILAKASSLIDGERGKQHGDRAENIQLIAAYWGLELSCSITPRQVCRMMALLKLARDKNGSFDLDNSVDACGYLAMGGEFGEQE